MKRWSKWISIIAAMLFLTACTEESAPEIAPGANQEESADSNGETHTGKTDVTGTDAQMATLNVDLYDSNAEQVGTAVLDEQEEGVILTINLENVSSGELSVHIHNQGTATPPSFEDAGEEIQLAELPSIQVSEDGSVNQTLELTDVSLLPDAENTLAKENGTSLILHSGIGEGAETRTVGGVILPPQ